MTVREDCRHYSTRTTTGGDVVQRCRLSANLQAPFACPDDCLFLELRAITDAGWRRVDTDDVAEPDDPAGPGAGPKA